MVETVDIELAAHHAVVETCRFAWTGSVPRYSSAPHWERVTSALGLGCVKTRRHSIAIEEVIRQRPFQASNSKTHST